MFRKPWSSRTEEHLVRSPGAFAAPFAREILFPRPRLVSKSSVGVLAGNCSFRPIRSTEHEYTFAGLARDCL